MYRKNHAQSRDAQRTSERLYYKFIACYVEGRYREIYEDAQQLFKQAKRENPGVRDLTKTDTYLKAVYPGAPIPRYYTTRKLKTSSPPTPPTQPQLVLNIPLLTARTIMRSSQRELATSPPEVSTQSEVTTPPEVSIQRELATSPPVASTQSEVTTPPEVSIQRELATSPPVASTQSEVTTPPEVSIQPEAATLPPEVSTPLFLPSELYQEVLNELRRDPEVWKCLNDFPIEDNFMDDGNMNDSVVQDMGDMFFDHTSTPLEIELATLDN